MGECRPGAEMSKTGKQAQTHTPKPGQLMGLQSLFSATQVLQLGCGRQSFNGMGAVSSPVGAESSMEPSKTTDKLCHLTWQ